MSVHTDPRVELAVIAAVLFDTPALTRAIVVDEKVRPEHFSDPSFRLVMRAAIDLHDSDSGTSVAAVHARLRDQITRERLDKMTIGDWSVDTIRELCRDLIRLHSWRLREHASELLRDAVATHDDTQLDRALGALAGADRQDDNARGEPAAITDEVLAHLDGKVDRPVWTWPLRKLNDMTHGGLRRGQVTLISGPTRHGKSVFLDQILEQTVADGASAELYLNEMTKDERGLRCAARGAVVPHGHIVNGEVTPQEASKVLDWANRGGVRFAMQECDGWTAHDIARDARHRRLDVVAVDLLDELPLIPGMGRRETAEESMRVFKQLAIGAGCHVLVVTHLNRNRSSQTAYVPMPSLNDIRESGMISNRAHNVLFVWREQERDTGDPEDEGVIRLAKARAGRLGGVPVRFDGDRQRFLLDHAPELRRAA